MTGNLSTVVQWAGTPTVAKYILVATVSSANDATTGVLATQEIPGGDPPPSSTDLSTLLTGKSDGPYRLWLQAADEAGNVSPEAAGPLEFTLDTEAPPTPINFQFA